MDDQPSELSDQQHPYWLPQGWRVEVKSTDFGRVRKSYINPENGHKFYTKPEVLRYLKGEAYVPQRRKEPKKVCVKRTAAEKLPDGWVKEVRRKIKGDAMRDDVYYVDPDTGHRFKSVKAALRYLEEIGEAVESEDYDEDHVNIERVVAEKLPTGWMKEIETKKKNGKIRKETYYVDPATGLYFRSMVEVCRYLGIEDPRKVKPGADDEDFISEESEDDSEIVNVKRSVAKYLPPGWIKEVVKRKKDDKIRYMTYYIDPATGDYFRSMPKACLYLGIEDPRKVKSIADYEDYGSSSSEAEGQRSIKYKNNNGKTVKKARGAKRGERMDNIPSRTSERLAARPRIRHTQAETSDESDENSMDDRTENLNQQNAPDTRLILSTPFVEEHEIACAKEDEKSETQPDPFIADEDQLVDVTILVDDEISPSGGNLPEPSLQLMASDESEH